MNNTITLVLGDWSGDGHDKTRMISILSNLDKDTLFAAYKKASKKLGFSFIDDVCGDYEDSLLPKEKLNILIKNGFKIENLGFNKTNTYLLNEANEAFNESGSDGLYLSEETYTNIFLFIVKLGNKDFKYEILKGKLNPTLDIGGYGLFE